MQWEYMTRDYMRRFDGEFVDVLDECGSRGWELVTILTRDEAETATGRTYDMMLVFKRPVVDEEGGES